MCAFKLEDSFTRVEGINPFKNLLHFLQKKIPMHHYINTSTFHLKISSHKFITTNHLEKKRRKSNKTLASNPPKPTTGIFPPPPEKPQLPMATTRTAATGVTSFHGPARWRAYYESSKTTNKLVVIDFTAQWCGPCKLMEPAVDGLASKYADVDFVKIDVDELMDAANEFGVHAMPTFLFMKRGQEIDKVVGVKKEELQRKVEKHRTNNNANGFSYYYY